MNLKNFVSVTLLVVLNVLSINAFAQSSVWKVSKGDNYFYLGGTIHVLSPEDHPLPEEFLSAYKDADKLIFEMDSAEAETPEAQQIMLTAMMGESPTTLIDAITPETYEKLKSFLAERSMPIEAFATFHPWAATLTVTLIEYQRAGMVPDYGVEQYFNKLALTDKKQLGSLETFEEQLSFLKTMGDMDPNEIVNYTLRDLDKLPEFITTMKDGWREGDLVVLESLVAEMKTEYPKLFHSLLTKRNNNWMPALTSLNDDETKEFVLVGAAHLGGDKGLIKQLESAGFKLEQI